MTKMVKQRWRYLEVAISLILFALTGCYRSMGYALPVQNYIKDTDIATMMSPLPTITPKRQVTLLAVGDIMLGRSIGELIQSQDPLAPFINVTTLFHQADWVIANLECAITESPTPEHKRYTFAAPKDAALGLSEAGISAVSLSNNHSMDFGPQGLIDTMSALATNNVLFFGAGLNEQQARTPLLLDKNGLSIAFLSYTDVPIESSSNFNTQAWIAGPHTPGLSWANHNDIIVDIQNAKKKADQVIVYFHYGIENLDHASNEQHDLALIAIDAGATLVLGAHPHRLQEVEHYKEGIIVYSLGNFIFDGFDDLANRSVVLKVILSEKGIIDLEWYPMLLVEGIPQPANPELAETILSIINREYTQYPSVNNNNQPIE